MKNLPSKINNWVTDLLQLLYPNECLICHQETPFRNAAICPVCEQELPFTYFENYLEATVLDKIFWGRVNISSTYALIYFQKGKRAQQLLHSLKYKNRPDLANYFGGELGKKLLQIEGFKDVDALIPVPLHPKKQFKRGYNQSEELAKGIAEYVMVPIKTNLLKRAVHAESQTTLNKVTRWENIQERFRSGKARKITELKHVVLVDDVVTTGATLETCVRLLREQLPDDCKISVVVLAMAK